MDQVGRDGAGGPRASYAARLDRAEAERERLRRIDRRLGNARLATALAGLVVAWYAAYREVIPLGWLALPVVLFVVLVVRHARAVRAREREDRRAAFYSRGLARLDRRAGGGSDGERFRDPEHPYAEDLDVFGRGSLFEALCTARTRSGEETLARWLLEGAGSATVRERQAAVAELAPQLDLHEELALAGTAVAAGGNAGALAAWAGERTSFPRGARVLATVLAAFNVGAIAAWALAGTAWPALAALVVSGSFALAMRPRVAAVLGSVDRPLADLRLLAGVLALVERQSFTAPRLAGLKHELAGGGGSPSGAVRALARHVEISEARLNQLFAPLAIVLLWGTHSALAVERWRTRHGQDVPRWLLAIGEFEALASLATWAFEHPGDPFPELVDGGPLLEATGIAHPLLAGAVENDVRLGGERPVWIVSGSNMSGKSTLLRAVGVNVVLALAGAPVHARRLVLSPLALGATLRVLDSLQKGSSRFYAEITRLRLLMERASAGQPLLFLLDEILHGTNSHDRLIGARAVIAGLVERGAIGLVTTHDLALADVAEGAGSRAVNVHFEDHLEEGRMTFDYRLRPGVVTKSNALELMRAVGLEV